MSLADLSIRRPVFVSCLVAIMLILGGLSLVKMPVDLFPDVTFPVVMVNTIYPGASPAEIETLISKVIEDEISTIAGIKSLSSTNKEGNSTVIAEFTLETDIKYAEQQIRDKVSFAKRKLPEDAEEPIIRRIDPADQPILIVALNGDLPMAQLYDLADQQVKPLIEQTHQVGLVEIIGGRKREIHVELDRKKLREHRVSASLVADRLAITGQNIPLGTLPLGRTELTYRTVGEFKSLDDIKNTVVNFMGNDVPVTIGDLGDVTDSLKDEASRTYTNGKKSVFIMVFRQSRANTIAVVDEVKKRIELLNTTLKNKEGAPELLIVRDDSKYIRANVVDVSEAIIIGMILTILVVYLFLGSGRSTIITGLALPNSLLGAFILMSVAGFSINLMSLLALSLAVGLLIDDAIVVRENIFRHLEMKKPTVRAAIEGTKEVTLAVIGTTLAVLAVFGPIGFLQGVVGQFFKQFGLTICFAMIISLFDALAMAPMLSAYFAGQIDKERKGLWGKTVGRCLDGFDRFQDWLEVKYVKILHWTLRRPFFVLGGALAIFITSLWLVKYVPKTFLPTQDAGEFMVTLELDPGTSLEGTDEVAKQVDGLLHSHPAISTTVMIVGSFDGQSNKAQFFVELKPSQERAATTSQVKDQIREILKPFSYANVVVKDIDHSGGGMRPFNVNIVGNDMDQLQEIAQKAYEHLKDHPGLKDVEIGFKAGRPELQVVLDERKAEQLGVSSTLLGKELRAQIEGMVPAVFRVNGQEYDIRVRLKPDQRNLAENFRDTLVPNINQSLVRLDAVARPEEVSGPSSINRQNKSRYIQISADISPDGPGMGAVMADIAKMFENEVKLPPDMSYRFVGQAENFQELIINMLIAALLGIIFIYLVLASLYESFVTPFTIMLVLPLAACGAFFALFVTQSSLDIFSMIGCIMLLGIASKNSILLVDYANQQVAAGLTRAQAILRAGQTRLRPILMTSAALIAGMLPVAIGLNEASKQRTSMGVAVIGGLISSTLLTLVVIPAAYSYIDRFREWSLKKARKLAGVTEDLDLPPAFEDSNNSLRNGSMESKSKSAIP